MKVKKIELANYTLAQELSNAITHGFGAVFGIVALVLMIVKICTGDNSDPLMFGLELGACIFYGSSIIICMTISCIYHSLAKNSGKKVMRIIDHAMVYLLVAGSYAAYCLIGLHDTLLWGIPGTEWSNYLILGISYVCIIIGVVFSSINMFKFEKLAMTMYLLGGLIILINPVAAYEALTLPGFLLLIFGGVAYVIGAVLYGIGRKKSLWFHTVFHVFVLIGIVLMFFSIYFYVI